MVFVACVNFERLRREPVAFQARTVHISLTNFMTPGFVKRWESPRHSRGFTHIN